jgi:nucleoporin SEH1
LYKIAWAHPEFGSSIAVACDRQVWFYEEACFGSKHFQNGWIKRVPAISDTLALITDLKFAPKYLGLKLVMCDQNGGVRIYECSDRSANEWTQKHPELKSTGMSSCSSCSWSTCLSLPVLLSIGCDEINTASEKLVIYEYNGENNQTFSKIEFFRALNSDKSPICSEPIRSLAFAPSIGKLYHVLAIASKSLIVTTLKTT